MLPNSHVEILTLEVMVLGMALGGHEVTRVEPSQNGLQRDLSLLLAREVTAERWPSVEEAGPCQTPSALAPCSWAPQSPALWERHFCGF